MHGTHQNWYIVYNTSMWDVPNLRVYSNITAVSKRWSGSEIPDVYELYITMIVMIFLSFMSSWTIMLLGGWMGPPVTKPIGPWTSHDVISHDRGKCTWAIQSETPKIMFLDLVTLTYDRWTHSISRLIKPRPPPNTHLNRRNCVNLSHIGFILGGRRPTYWSEIQVLYWYDSSENN